MDVYNTLNSAFSKVTTVLFGGPVGELKDFEPWLKEEMPKPLSVTSSISQKPVEMGINSYMKSKFMSFDEVNFFKRYEPLNINEIKDIDSIIEALRERDIFYYTGNVVLGNSRIYEKVNKIVNSNFVYDGFEIYDSKYIAFSSFLRYSEWCFGVHGGAKFKFAMRIGNAGFDQRVFESHNVTYSNDIYYSGHVDSSQEVMFSFNIYGKKYIIGNLQLSPEKYRDVKRKLLEEMRDELESKKRLPSLGEILGEPSEDVIDKVKSVASNFNPNKEEENIYVINEAFSKTSNVVLGRQLSLLELEDYLFKNIPFGKPIIMKGILSDLRFAFWPVFRLGFLSRSRIIHRDEGLFLSSMFKLSESDINALSIKDPSTWRPLSLIGFFPPTVVGGQIRNLILCQAEVDSVNAYKVLWPISSKNVAFSFWPRNSEYTFGSSVAFSTQFCINCYSSEQITRGFEVDSSYNSSDVYFSHNVENVHDCFFCFNVKNLRNAIGNAQLSREKYIQIKSSLLSEISSEIESNKSFKWSIYNIGAVE